MRTAYELALDAFIESVALTGLQNFVTAGDRNRTGGVQLGKMTQQIVEKLRKPRAFQYFIVANPFRKASHGIAFFRIVTGYFRKSGVKMVQSSVVFC